MTVKGYYVTVKRDRRTGWLYGPFACHALAKAFVPIVRAAATIIDPFCDFDGFGTSSIEGENLPKGVLNAHLAKIIVDNDLKSI